MSRKSRSKKCVKKNPTALGSGVSVILAGINGKVENTMSRSDDTSTRLPAQPDFTLTSSAGVAASWINERIARGKTQRCCEVVTVTPEIAAECLKLNTNNRPINKSKVSQYCRVMQEGRWKLTTEALSFSKSGALLNGQHRLNAIIESGVGVRMTVWFGADDEEFAVIDIGHMRTAADILSIEKMPNAAIRGALATHLVRMRDRRMGVPDKGAIRDMALKLEGTVFGEACAAGNRANKVCAPSSAALAYFLIARDSRRSERLPDFWNAFVIGAELKPNSPILKLRDSLGQNQLVKIFGVGGQTRMVRVAAAIIFTWNAWSGHKERRVSSFAWNKFFDLPEVL